MVKKLVPAPINGLSQSSRRPCAFARCRERGVLWSRDGIPDRAAWAAETKALLALESDEERKELAEQLDTLVRSSVANVVVGTDAEETTRKKLRGKWRKQSPAAHRTVAGL